MAVSLPTRSVKHASMFPQAEYIRPKGNKGGLVAREEPSGHKKGRQAAAVMRRASKLWRSRWSLNTGSEGCLLDANSTDALRFDVENLIPTVPSPKLTSTSPTSTSPSTTFAETAFPTEASSALAAQTSTWSDQYTLLGSPVTVSHQEAESPLPPTWSLDALEFIVPLPPLPCELTKNVQKHIKTYAKWYDFDITYLVKLTYFDAARRNGNSASRFPSFSTSSSIHLAAAHLIAVHDDEKLLPGALEISPAFHREVLRKRWHHAHFLGTEVHQLRYGWAAAHCIANNHYGLDYLVFGGCRLMMPDNPNRLVLDDILLEGLELSVHSLARYVAAAS